MKAHYSLVGLMVILCASTLAFAQEPEFNLKNYQTTNYERSELSVYFRLSENYSNKTQNQDTPGFVFSDQNSNLGSALNGNYHSINYKPEKFVESNVNFSSNIDLNNSERDISDNNYYYLDKNVMNVYLSTSHIQERYYGENLKNFFFLKPTLNASIYSHNEFNVSDLDTFQSNYLNIEIPSELSIELGHGYGRIEFVEDAVEAIYILSELEEKGVLANKADPSMIEVLANKIKQLKEERYLDGRIYRAYVLEELVTLFKEENWVVKESVALFNTLNDYHFMAGINNRKAGSKFKYGIAPELAFLKSNNEFGSDYSRFKDGISLILSYENYVPVNIKWQRSFNSNLTAGIEKVYFKYDYDDSFNKNSNTPLSINFSNQYAVGYLPNTRTQLSASVFGNWNYTENLNNNANGNSYSNIDFGLNLGGNYYFSEHLRLTSSFSLYDNVLKRHLNMYNPNLNANEVVLNTENKFRQSFNVALNYYIF